MISSISGYALLVIYFGLELFMRRGRRAKSLKPNAFDQGTAILIGAAYPIGIFLAPILNHFSLGRFPAAGVASVVGITLMIMGLAIRLWSMQTLGRFYTRILTISEGQKIVEEGPYRIIRHPGYLGTLLVWIGLPASQANWMAVCLVILVMGMAYGRRIKAEEAMLVREFGEEYRKYMKRTWRLLPYLL